LPFQLNTWKQKIVGFAGTLGAPGLFLISFLDSSVLTFPVINDLLLIELSIEHPARMPLYALMAATGSVLGCVLLYFIARKGGEAFFHRKAGHRAAAIRHWVEENGFVGMLIARCCHRQRHSSFLCLPRAFSKFRFGVIHPRLRWPA